MICINSFSKDVKFKDAIKKIVGNLANMEEQDYDLQIVNLTDQPQRILKAIENQYNLKSGLNIYIIDVDGESKKEGLELAKKIRSKDALATIVYVANAKCDARELIQTKAKASAFFYKPIGTYEFLDLIDDVVDENTQITALRTQYMSGHIVINSRYKSNIVFLSDIISVEYDKPKSVINTTYGQIKVNLTLQEMYNKLIEADGLGTIIRPHQGFIVNVANAKIADYKNLKLIMKKDIVVPIARSRKKDVSCSIREIMLRNNTEFCKIKK